MTLSGDNLMRVKRSNRSALLYALHQNGAMSRKRLSQTMGLTPAAITKITADMLSEGLIRESGALPTASAGRREILLEIHPDSRCALGVLINLRKATLSAVRMNGTSVFLEELAIPAQADADKTTELLCARLMALTEEHELPPEQILGVGVAVRGILTPDCRSVADSFGALAQKDYPLCDRIEALTGYHAVLENNVRALFAAQRFFDREGSDGPQFFLRCEYGIGAAMTIDGQIQHGSTQQCAEIGHIPVIRRGGKLCSCGKTGCLETVASPAAIAEAAADALSEQDTPILWRAHRAAPDKSMDVEDVLTAAAGGDAGAGRIVDEAVIALAGALKSVVYLLDPNRIVLYGRMFDHPYFLSRLLGEMQEGMDGSHAVALEKSRYNRTLDRSAAALLAVRDCFDRGGM